MPEYITTGEFSRWADGDREWKQTTLECMMDTRERVALLEGVSKRADKADSSASKAKRWAIIGTSIGAVIGPIVNGIWTSLK
jgi:hypothetical protein